MADFIKKIATNEGDKQIDFQALGNFPVAQAGQLLKVKSVDENGKPTEWEAADVKETLKESGVSLGGGGLAKKIASFETAGSYQWTAPDLADGKAYKIGVMIIGAGGSGASASTSTKYTQYGGGGASGYAKSHIETVDPGETKNLVVGKGGTSVGGSSAVDGKPGGTSSFDGIAVNGGAEGHWCNSNSGGYGDRSIGARCGNPFGAGSFGFELPYFNNSSSDSTFDDIPWMCFNPFEGVEILGSGGSATWATNSTVTYKNGGKNTDGKGGGNAGNPGVKGELPGCGGGGTVNLKKSGAGADGAVYIYFLGVADE